MDPRRVSPYFVLVALIHAGAVATRFDVIAAKIPPGVAFALMIGQFPLLVLSGFFEGQLAYGETSKSLPLWMRIRSVPVKLAFTFGFMYVACVAMQTWNISLGPINPTPPAEWPTQQRAMYFAMFTAGFFFPFYLAATSLLVPVLRALTWPLRKLPALLGGVLALVVGGGLGVVVFALVTSSKLGAFVSSIQATIAADPALALGITLAMTLGPLAIGLALDKLKGAPS
ncbi:MAG TPA: hypothetical protein VLX92_25800 [Kofleriaceae bacterium]|nr:hypothetical protein [Kofleriaceae bacterium]